MSERIGTQKLDKASDAVNPEFHHEFEALCAIYYSGEISEEEWALLQIHMAYCDSCHEKFLQYQQIASNLIPAMAAAAATDGAETAQGADQAWAQIERRLMSGISSTPGPKRDSGAPRRRWQIAFALAAACAVGVACLFGIRVLRNSRGTSSPAGQSGRPSLPRTSPAQDRAASEEVRQKQLESDRERIASLKRQVVTAEDRLKQADAETAALERQLNVDEAARTQLNEEKDTLAQELASTRTALDAMRNRLEMAASESATQNTQRAALETRVRELQADLEERDVALSDKDRMLALDKEFLSHDRDIRDLIGARNLYIADIFDTNANGKTAKQFGRIFYTRDRSLIFYGFDLDSQAGRRQDVSFQAWGSGSDRSSPISLGLFYQDDSHKRWVLRCNDPKALARLDMVFVTVEPPGGSSRPTGKPLLRAYLQIHPNHP